MKTVLFVDDDEAYRQICRRVFEDEGYRVLLAEDGMQAMAVVNAESLDVVILDVRMPRMSGLDVAEKIKAIKPKLPIILYTANDEICSIDRRARLAEACIDKSSDFTELAIAVSRVLSRGNQGDAFRFGLPQ
jgi:DNA-binding NtrC family response regulator